VTDDLVKFLIPAQFVADRVALRPAELAYGYRRGWLDEAGVVALAEDALRSDKVIHPALVELALILRDDLDRVPELIAKIDTGDASSTQGVWLYLALDWIHGHRESYADVLQAVEMLYADFDYPLEIEGFVRFMPIKPGMDVGTAAIEERWQEYLEMKAQQFGDRDLPS
jgi:hypothetical protein